MDNFQKYSRLMLLIVGGFFGFLIAIALLIYILRLFSITMFHIPGFDLFFQYVIIIIPYLIFFAAYYYLYKKISFSKTKASRVIARCLLVAGLLTCLFTLFLSTALFLKVKNEWLKSYEESTHYALVIQLVVLFLTAGILASGDAKEKDWMERREG
ncbi:MAG: hypothetical protein ABIN01_10565 [Ferruginibacter sp.]